MIRSKVKRYLIENIEDIVENDIEVWKERYYRKSKDSLIYDIITNRDYGGDYELLESELGIELTGEEMNYYYDIFIDTFIDNFFK